jgi:hypothetical protein
MEVEQIMAFLLAEIRINREQMDTKQKWTHTTKRWMPT